MWTRLFAPTAAQPLSFVTATQSAMATADPRPGAVMSWMASIRTTMASDPGRQAFEDEIQSTGFHFLEDYLANILAGPKHE